MSIQLNINKIKKLSSNNKKIHIVYNDFQMVYGHVEEIGNLYVYIKTDDQVESVAIEIEKIKDISARKNEFYEAQMLEHMEAMKRATA